MSALATLAAAAAVVQQPALPPESKQFDFWVGDWKCVGDSVGPDGKKTKTEGVNTIKRSHGGHVVEEHFRMGDFEGTSVSVYSPHAKKWFQTWVDSSGGYIPLSGEFVDGKMILKTLTRPDQPDKVNRMVFYNIMKDSFDWDWEASSDGGKTWKLSWRLHYTRVK